MKRNTTASIIKKASVYMNEKKKPEFFLPTNSNTGWHL